MRASPRFLSVPRQSLLRVAVRRALTLGVEEATFAKRGFVGDAAKRTRLERIGTHFIHGYNLALHTTDDDFLMVHLPQVEPELRGFAVEGAAMSIALMDAFVLWGRRLNTFRDRIDEHFIYLAHVGAGWAMARVPWRRSRILGALDPFLKPLAYDGWGFHDTYFQIRRRRGVDPLMADAYWQGTGRASWFAYGADVTRLASLVASHAGAHRADLWSGIGLAAAYAGGATKEDLTHLLAAAGQHRCWLSQGAAFAAEARHRSGCVPAHTDLVCLFFTHRDAATCATLVRAVRGLPSIASSPQGYAAWRHEVARQLES